MKGTFFLFKSKSFFLSKSCLGSYRWPHDPIEGYRVNRN